MKDRGTRRMNLADIKQNLFVRKALDTDHVLYLAELIEGKVDVGTIEVDTNDVIVDGRHRKEAYELNNLAEVEVRVLEFKSEAEMIAYAYKANTGGSKPPTPQDTEHTVMLLITQGESMKKIGEMLGLPTNMTRKYVTEMKSRMNRAKLQTAAAAVTDNNLTVAKAAEEFDVDAEKLKELLSGHRRKDKKGLQEVKALLTKTYKSTGLKNAAAIKRLFVQLEDGDISEKQVRKVLEHLEHLQKTAARTLKDWRDRFEALAKSLKTP